MRGKKTFFTLAIALTLICGMVIGANAADTLKEITAYLNYGITIRYNGEAQNLTDAGGNRVYPITYNGTTYLPVRAVSNMLGIGVDWDGATQSVLLGTQAADLIDDFKPYTDYVTEPNLMLSSDAPEFIQSSQKETTDAGGETISHWLKFWNISEDPEQELICSFNLGGKYSSLSFKVYSSKDTTLTVKGDNDSVLGEYNLIGGQVPQTITVDLQNTTQLTFIRNSPNTYTNTYIYSAFLK